jgi:DNA-binding IclR family transcriptional regulator
MLGTLARAGAVLDLFSLDEPEWGVTAVAQRLGVSKSLAHDVLSSLAAIGLLQRVGHGRYRLGWRTVTLATVLLRTSELKAHARPVVRDLVERQGLTVSLTAWDRVRVIYIDRHARGRPVGGSSPMAGTAVPLDGRAVVKVLLASRPESEVQSLWDQGLVLTPHASVDALHADLAKVREHGWALDDADHAAAHAVVAAPVRDADGEVAAAISVDFARPFSTSTVAVHARVVTHAASRISAAIRHPRACAVPSVARESARTAPVS